jgi:hypothetical protein
MKQKLFTMVITLLAIAGTANAQIYAYETDGPNKFTVAVSKTSNLSDVTITISMDNSNGGVMTATQWNILLPTGATFIQGSDNYYSTFYRADKATMCNEIVRVDGSLSTLCGDKNLTAITGTTGKMADVHFNASTLADGDYTITLKNPIMVRFKDAEVRRYATTTNPTCKFTIKSGVLTGIGGVTIDGQTPKSIYTLDGRKVETTVPGNVYIVDGVKKVMK